MLIENRVLGFLICMREGRGCLIFLQRKGEGIYTMGIREIENE